MNISIMPKQKPSIWSLVSGKKENRYMKTGQSLKIEAVFRTYDHIIPGIHD
jgi:hypothetical protein